MNKLISLVIPAYNEAENLQELFQRVNAVTHGVAGYKFEFLVIDNRSTDATGKLAMAQCEKDPRWHYLRFSRNFGAEVSLAAGLKYARGEAVIFLFSDLQEPPECIPALIRKWEEGYDVVYGVLEHREDSNVFKKLGAWGAYKLIEKLSDVQIPANATDYRLMSRKVVDALNGCGEANRYLRGLVHWVGFEQAGVPYKRAARRRGKSSADLFFMLRFAINAIISFSGKPLQMAGVFGLFMMLLSVAGVVLYILLLALSNFGLGPTKAPPPGWTTMIIVILFFGGIQNMFLGIIGEYIANIYREVKDRPIWIVDEQVGLSDRMGKSDDR